MCIRDRYSCIDLKQDTKKNYSFNKVLVAIGRKPYLNNLGLEKINIEVNSNGTIKVDKNFQTSTSGIYAIGDVIDGPMLAHKASSEGHVFAENILGKYPEVNYNCIPAVVYTEPEVAWVGPTEKDLIKSNTPYKKGLFPLQQLLHQLTHLHEHLLYVPIKFYHFFYEIKI